MTIDNFNLMVEIMDSKPDLPEAPSGYFYFLQILRRHKENPEMSSNNELIKSFYIQDSKYLIAKREKIITVCKQNNARAYLRLNRRSYKQCALYAISLIAQSIATGNYNIRKCYESAIGQHNAEGKNKTWVVDVDGEVYDPGIETTIFNLILETGRTPAVITVPTKNGRHFITPPFNLQTFNTKYPRVDVLKDNPTILYIP